MSLGRLFGRQDPISSTSNHLAIHGYDPVAYFAEKRPVKGREEFSFEWKGAIWQFSNESNQERFMANPEIYCPQYGGYCAYGISHGRFCDSDPEIWNILDGKLYLNLNQNIARQWEEKMRENIKRANDNWPKLIT